MRQRWRRSSLVCKRLQPRYLDFGSQYVGKNGFQSTEQIKRIHPNIKIIVSTVYASEKSIEKDADDHLIKPYTKQALIESIESVIE